MRKTHPLMWTYHDMAAADDDDEVFDLFSISMAIAFYDCDDDNSFKHQKDFEFVGLAWAFNEISPFKTQKTYSV